VACLVLVSFGYTSLPFWPQGRNYEAYFTDAAGIAPGNASLFAMTGLHFATLH